MKSKNYYNTDYIVLLVCTLIIIYLEIDIKGDETSQPHLYECMVKSYLRNFIQYTQPRMKPIKLYSIPRLVSITIKFLRLHYLKQRCLYMHSRVCW